MRIGIGSPDYYIPTNADFKDLSPETQALVQWVLTHMTTKPQENERVMIEVVFSEVDRP